MSAINCTLVDHESVICDGSLFKHPEKRLSYEDEWFWIYLGIYVTLVLLAGLMSGLTMGLLSLDMMTLRILRESGTSSEQKYAKTIIPVVKHHHLLLVTLLLANAVAVESMPIFLDRVSDPIVAICVSVTAVLFFGEVIPQALCTRYGLAIGATLSPFVYFLMGLLFLIAWPVSKFLDCLFGKEHDMFYRRAQLKALVDIHAQPGKVEKIPTEANLEQLTSDEVMIIKGALDMSTKTAKNAMMPLQDVYLLSSNDCIDRKTMEAILRYSHSRVPVYDEQEKAIVGLLLVKTLIMLSPNDATPVRELMKTTSFHRVPFVPETMPLFDLLNLFQTGKSHLCIVTEDSSSEQPLEAKCEPPDNAEPTAVLESKQGDKIIGIITLEDVIEELIQEEIVDETDVFVDIHKKIQVARAKVARQTSCFEKLHGRDHQKHRNSVKDSTTVVEVHSEPFDVTASNVPDTSESAPLISFEQ